jgi:hypothetical protein
LIVHDDKHSLLQNRPARSAAVVGLVEQLPAADLVLREAKCLAISLAPAAGTRGGDDAGKSVLFGRAEFSLRLFAGDEDLDNRG